MAELFFRTEDIKSEEVLTFFAETSSDRAIIEDLKGKSPVVLSGSRGVGKSFLLKVAEAELFRDFSSRPVLPIYVSFSKSSLLNTNDPLQFQHWMMARICARIIRVLNKQGLLSSTPASVSILAGDSKKKSIDNISIEKVAESFENSWRQSKESIDLQGIPDADSFKDAIEDLCEELNIERVVLLIDEAAHILYAEQQRQFFTLFRDLRSPYISCKAAVYPGVTSYGESFQPAHDALMLNVDRDVLSPDYVSNMREIVEKQSDSSLIQSIALNAGNFSIIAYAASGNPRLMLKTLSKTAKLNSTQVNDTIREYYRTEIWAEHSLLGEKYAGHEPFISWGRKFIESEVLKDIHAKNTQYLADDKEMSSSFFWIHKDAPQPVKEALRLLSYTGIVKEHANGMKATRAEIGTRYIINLGCLFAMESKPAATALAIVKKLDPKRMTEYGANHSAYKSLISSNEIFKDANAGVILHAQLDKEVKVLDITEWQKSKLAELGLLTLRDVLSATETKLQEAKYVGEIRARRMRNATLAAVFEYLSG